MTSPTDEFGVSSRVWEKLEKAGLDSQQILLLDSCSLRRLTDLSEHEIRRVKVFHAEQLVASKFLKAADVQLHFLSTGCKILDEELGGGFARRGITEVTGESGVGKTQLCLQAALSVQLPPAAGGAGSGAVYICTEDSFPSARLQQLLQLWPATQQCSEVPPAAKLSDNIFIEHIADVDCLTNCISTRLPNLLHRRQIGLIVVDSIAGPFRAEYDLQQGAVIRAEVLKNIGHHLYDLANIHNLAVICVNQVAAVIEEDESTLVPALGLAWANLVTTRLHLHRTRHFVTQPPSANAPTQERLLEVVFSPYLAAKCCSFVVTETGVQGIIKPST